jgi:hypothetical protein
VGGGSALGDIATPPPSPEESYTHIHAWLNHHQGGKSCKLQVLSRRIKLAGHVIVRKAKTRKGRPESSLVVAN